MKTGDKIKCVRPNDDCFGITIGKIYEVRDMDTTGDPYILNDRGDESAYKAYRFRVENENENDINTQIDRAISLIGKTVKDKDGRVFTVTDWGVTNIQHGYTGTIKNLVDGVCVYVEDDYYLAPLCDVTEVTNIIKLTDDYTAIIEGENVEVGCQTIPIEKVKQIVEIYNTLKK